MKTGLLLLLSSFLAVACTSITPIKEGAGDIAAKEVMLPRVGQKMHVPINGLVLLKASYKSGYRYSLKSPLDVSFVLGTYGVRVSSSEELVPKHLENKEFHCTTSRSVWQLMGPGSSDACFEVKDSKIHLMKYAPSAYWFSESFSPPLEVVRREVAMHDSPNPTKVEIVYQGYSNGRILFLKKEYGANLELPVLTSPLSVEDYSNGIDILGAKIIVDKVDSRSLTFSVDRW